MDDVAEAGNELKPIVEGAVRPLWQRLHLTGLDPHYLLSQADLQSQVEQSIKSYMAESPQADEDAGLAEIAGNLAYRAVCRRIWQGCQSQDEAEQSAVYQWLGEYCYRHIEPKCGPQVAEDLTNETLAKVYDKFASCSAPDFFLKWVAQIATREVLQYVRKNKKTSPRWDNTEATLQRVRQLVNFDPDGQTDLPDAAPGPEEIVLSREGVQAIFERIHRWGKGKRARHYQTILYWTYFLGRSDEEIAAWCELSVADTQKMRSHALKVLRADHEWLDSIR